MSRIVGIYSLFNLDRFAGVVKFIETVDFHGPGEQRHEWEEGLEIRISRMFLHALNRKMRIRADWNHRNIPETRTGKQKQ
jgi:hypothetical protein